MRIKYNVVEDDAVAAYIVIARHSPYVRRQRVISGLIVLGLFLVIVLSKALYSKDWGVAVIGVVIAVGLAVWILAGKNRRTGRVARKLFREGKNKGFLGVHELEINDYGILTKSEYGEGKIAWAVIEHIVSTPDYTFLFTGANKAIPLPKSRILEGDYDAFVAELTSRFEQFTVKELTTTNIKQAPVIVDQKVAFCEDGRAGKHSGYGIISFMIALAAVVAVFLAFMAVLICAIIVGGPADKGAPLFIVFGVVFVLAWGIAFIGAGFGIAGLLSKNRKKLFAAIGLGINLLIILSVVLIILVRSIS
ncbi:MAG: YcxB family protein [Sedimentisphaerales bacterium]|jgi:hypothetical protein